MSVFSKGVNVTLMTFGELDTRKWHFLTGDRSDRSISLTIDYLFGELLTEKRLAAGEFGDLDRAPKNSK